MFEWNQESGEDCVDARFYLSCFGCDENKVEIRDVDNTLIFHAKDVPGSEFVLHLNAEWRNRVKSPFVTLRVKVRDFEFGK